MIERNSSERMHTKAAAFKWRKKGKELRTDEENKVNRQEALLNLI